MKNIRLSIVSDSPSVYPKESNQHFLLFHNVPNPFKDTLHHFSQIAVVVLKYFKAGQGQNFSVWYKLNCKVSTDIETLISCPINRIFKRGNVQVYLE